MAKSDMEAPLLGQTGRASEEGVAGLGHATAAKAHVENSARVSACEWRSRTTNAMLLLAVCCVGAIVLFGFSHDRNVRLQNEAESDEAKQLMFLTAQHTKYHFQAAKYFMSDPCAPMYYKGYYHLWYQWNPYDSVWGNMTWGHAVSTDLIHWQYLPVSLEPDQWYDMQGVFSGYVTIVDEIPVVLYTGGRGLFGGDANQSISMARPVDPSDPLLLEWTKVDANPLILTPVGDSFSSQAFRDPTTAWLEEDDPLWRMSVPSVIINPDGSRDGVGFLYTSLDFYNWTLSETYLHSVKGTGTWECLDLFPVICESELGKGAVPQNPEVYHDGMKYVLKAGLDETRVDFYAMGTYSTKTHTWIPDDPDLDVGTGLRYDYGRFYASKTFYDTTKNRRVLWGYIHESDSQADDRAKGWACLLSIPRTVWLDPNTGRTLLQWPIEELDTLRGAHASYKDIDLHPSQVMPVIGGNGEQLDIVVAFEKPDVSGEEGVIPTEEFDCRGGADRSGMFGPFGLMVLADKDLIEHTDIYFYIGRKTDGEWSTVVCSDQSRSSVYDGDIDRTVYGAYLEVLESEDELSFRVLLDHSVVETYVQRGRFTITARMYPTLALGNNARLFLFNNGNTHIKVKNLDVYQMRTVTMSDFEL